MVENPDDGLHPDPESVRPGSIGLRILPDGREATVYPMTFGKGRLCVGAPDAPAFDDGWCYERLSHALAALILWDGDGEPDGWIRHLGSGRRRPDGDATKEFIQP